MEKRQQAYIDKNRKKPNTLDTQMFEEGVIMSAPFYNQLKSEKPATQYEAQNYARRRRLLKAAPKFTDVVGNFTADLQTATPDPIVIDVMGLMQRGYNSYGQFVGDQVELILNTFRSTFYNTIVSTANRGIMFWLFQYHGPITATASGILVDPVPDVFVNMYLKPDGVTPSPLSWMLANKNHTNGKHIKTIWRRWFAMNAHRRGGYESMTLEIQADLIEKCKPVIFQNTTTGNIRPVDGNLLLMVQDTRDEDTDTATNLFMVMRTVYGQ